MNQKIRLLLYGGALWYLGEGMFGPLLAVFTEQIGGSVLDITWAWAIYLIVTGVLTVIVGKISDGKISKEKLMIVGYTLNAALTFTYLLVDSPIKLFLVQGGLGVAAALASPTWSALFAKFEDRKRSGFEWGLAGGEYSIVTGLAILIGGIIVNYFSFTVLFLIMGFVQILATLDQAQILFKSKK